MHLGFTWIGALAGVIVAASLGETGAQTLATEITVPGGTFHGGSDILGWSFSVNEEVEVTALGQWDWQQNGLLNPATIGIFDNATESLLVSAMVANGTGPPLENEFRMVDLPTPLRLEVGKQYAIGSNVADQVIRSDDLFGATEFSTAPEVNLIEWRFESGTTLAYPFRVGLSDPDSAGNAYFGPTFRFRSISPSATTWHFAGPLKLIEDDSGGTATYSSLSLGELMRGRFHLPLSEADGIFVPPSWEFPVDRFHGVLSGDGVTTNSSTSARPLEIRFLDDTMLDNDSIELVNSCLGTDLPAGTRADLAEIETDLTIGNRRLEFGLSFISLDLSLLTGPEYRPFPTAAEVDLAVYFVVEEIDDEEVYFALGLVTEFAPHPPTLRITNISRTSDLMTVEFDGTPGVSGWQVMGGANLSAGFPDLLAATIAEQPLDSGHYSAEVDVSGRPADYFLRIED